MSNSANTLDVSSFQSDVAGWSKEANVLLELGQNAERTGVPADQRTRDRAKTLLTQIQDAVQRVETGSVSANAHHQSELRLLKAQLDALHQEAEKACGSLRA